MDHGSQWPHWMPSSHQPLGCLHSHELRGTGDEGWVLSSHWALGGLFPSGLQKCVVRARCDIPIMHWEACAPVAYGVWRSDARFISLCCVGRPYPKDLGAEGREARRTTGVSRKEMRGSQ